MPPKAPANSNSEVLQDWGDYVPSAVPAGLSSAPSAGPYTFERSRLEKAVQYVCTDMAEKDRAKEKEKRAKVVAAAKKVKKEDVEFLVSATCRCVERT